MMIRKTLTTILTVAAISSSAMFATATASNAGGYYGGYYGGYGKHYGWGYHKKCFYKKVKVHGYYGWHWKKIRICH